MASMRNAEGTASELLRAWVPPEEQRDEAAARARVRRRLDAHLAMAPSGPVAPARARPRRTQATYLDQAIIRPGLTVPMLNTRTREAWISQGRSGAERTIGTQRRFPSARARAAWLKAGRFPLAQVTGKKMMSAMLAEREVMLHVPKELAGLVPPGTVVADAVYEQRAVVDRLGQRP